MGTIRAAVMVGVVTAVAFLPVASCAVLGRGPGAPIRVACATAEPGVSTCVAVPPGGDPVDVVWAENLPEDAAQSAAIQPDTGQGPAAGVASAAPFPEWLGGGVLAHEGSIRTAARELELDPLALAVLISIECPSGNGDCRSHAGARGIAQVMPETGATIQSVTGYPCASSPYDPLTSIRCGGWYFREGLRRSAAVWRADSEATALGAAGIGYNAGHGWIPVVLSHVRAGGYVCAAPVPSESKRWCELFVSAWKRAGRS